MTLRLRLVLGLAAVVLLLATPLGLALHALRGAESAASNLRTQDVAASLLLGRVRATTQALRDNDLSATAGWPGDPRTLSEIDANAATLHMLADSTRAYGLNAFAAQIATTAAIVAANGPAEWTAYANKQPLLADSISTHRVIPALVDVDRALAEATREIDARAERHTSEVETAAGLARQQAFSLFVAALAGALAVTVWLTRTVSGSVRTIERGLAAVAAGRFDHTLGVRASDRDEFGRLAGSFEQMAAKLAELDKLKSAFVSVASHELKTPINVILGYLTLLNDGIYGPVAESQCDVLSTIERQTRTLSRLVQHLLDVSRFEAGVARLELRPVALRPILHETEQSHAVLAHQRNIAFHARVAPELPDVVTWDADRVREVLDNLLSNAVKFTPPGGSVELEVSCDRRQHPPSVRLTVCDSGVGIPAEQLPRVFEKFYQANNQGGAAAKGTGLGLAISKEIVEAHGGFIEVSSTPGVCTEFVVTLPVTAHDVTALVTADERPEPDHETDALQRRASAGATIA